MRTMEMSDNGNVRLKLDCKYYKSLNLNVELPKGAIIICEFSNMYLYAKMSCCLAVGFPFWFWHSKDIDECYRA